MQHLLGRVGTGFLDTGMSFNTDCVGLFRHVSRFLTATTENTGIFEDKSQHSNNTCGYYMWAAEMNIGRDRSATKCIVTECQMNVINTDFKRQKMSGILINEEKCPTFIFV